MKTLCSSISAYFLIENGIQFVYCWVKTQWVSTNSQWFLKTPGKTQTGNLNAVLQIEIYFWCTLL